MSKAKQLSFILSPLSLFSQCSETAHELRIAVSHEWWYQSYDDVHSEPCLPIEIFSVPPSVASRYLAAVPQQMVMCNFEPTT